MAFDKFGFGVVEASPISGWAIAKHLAEISDNHITPVVELSPNQLAVAWQWGNFNVKVHLSHMRPKGKNIYVPCRFYHIPINVITWY